MSLPKRAIDEQAAEETGLEQATAAELRAFGQVAWGLELTGREGGPVMIAKLREAGHTGNTIVVYPEAKPQSEAHARGRQTYFKDEKWIEFGKNGKKIEHTEREYGYIRIPSHEGPGGKDPVPVGVNGTNMFILRDTNSEVPVEYIEVLQNAYVRVWDDKMEKHTEHLRFPFQWLSPPTDNRRAKKAA